MTTPDGPNHGDGQSGYAWSSPSAGGQPHQGQPQWSQPDYSQQQGYGQQSYGQSNTSRNAAQSITRDGKGFLGALFDFSFKNFIAIEFVKAAYFIAIVGYALVWLFAVIFGLGLFNEGFFEGIIGLIIGVVIGGSVFLVGVLGARVTLEFFVAMFRTAQNTGDLVDLHKNR